MTTSEDPVRFRSAVPRLHVVTDDAVLSRGDILPVARKVFASGGAKIVFHLRGPRTSGARLYQLAVPLRDAARSAGTLFLVNDRIDVALSVGAHGVHLGRRSLPVSAARWILGPRATFGVSTHTMWEVEKAASDGADFAFVGTVYETPSHPGRRGGGAEILAAARDAAPRLRLVAIGGLSVERTPEALSAGADGIAVIRGIWSERDPEGAVRRYLEVLDELGGRDAAAAETPPGEGDR